MFTFSCNLWEECHPYLWLRDKHRQINTHTLSWVKFGLSYKKLWCLLLCWFMGPSDSSQSGAVAAGESSVRLKTVSFSINLWVRLFKVSWKQITTIVCISLQPVVVPDISPSFNIPFSSKRCFTAFSAKLNFHLQIIIILCHCRRLQYKSDFWLYHRWRRLHAVDAFHCNVGVPEGHWDFFSTVETV